MLSGCIICYDSFETSSNGSSSSQENVDKVNVVSTKCGHVFHDCCIKEWLKQSKTCPECRSRIRKKSLTQLFINFCSDIPPDVNAERALKELEKKLGEKNLECMEKKGEILDLQLCCAELEKEILQKNAKILDLQTNFTHLLKENREKNTKIEELQTAFVCSELDCFEKETKIEKLLTCFTHSVLEHMNKDTKIEELQICLARSDLACLEKEKKILELELCIAHAELESLEKVKKSQTNGALSEQRCLEKEEKIQNSIVNSEKNIEKLPQHQIKLCNEISNLKQEEEKNLNQVEAKNQNLLQDNVLKCVNNIDNDTEAVERGFSVIKKILEGVQVHSSGKENIFFGRIASCCSELLQLQSHSEMEKTHLQSEIKWPSHSKEDKTQLPIKVHPAKRKASTPQAVLTKRGRQC